MGHKKDKTKTFTKVGTRTISVDELLKSVNKFDKEYDIDLKNSEIWLEPEMSVTRICANADFNIAALICIINGIEINEYFVIDETYGIVSKPINITDEEFTSRSNLNWDDNEILYDTTDPMFRLRFCTLVLSSILGRTEKISKLQSEEKFKYPHSINEHRIMDVTNMLNYMVKFIQLMLNPKNTYRNIILLMNEYTIFSKKRYDHMEVRNMTNGFIINTRKGLQKDLLSGQFLSDDLAIYNILKIAYMLATNNTNADKVIPKFKHIEGATLKYDLSKLIEELGLQILKNTKNNKYAPMFRAFLEARPYITTQFYKECKKNYPLNIGVLALAYTKFVFDDKYTDKFIDRMLEKGI